MKKLLITVLAVSAAAASYAQQDDRDYTKDYSGTKATISMLDEASGTAKSIVYKDTTDINGIKNFVFAGADGNSGEILVPVNTKFKFAIRQKEQFKAGSSAFDKGNYAGAVKAWRDTIYTYLPILEMPEHSTFSMHQDVANYMEALVKAKRLKEAEGLSKAIPYDKAGHTLSAAGLSLARAFVAADMFDAAQDILSRTSFTGDNIDLIPDAMLVLADLRKKNRAKQALLWYTKLSNIAENPQKQGALVWMVYCDLVSGNRASAEVYLSQIGNLKRDDKYFSLLQMIKGIFKSQEKKYSEALDLYAEGIVYGDVSADWTPELLYRAGLTYKTLKQVLPANEIFSQCALLYPDDAYSKLGSKEIVKIPEAKKGQTNPTQEVQQ